MSKKRIIQLAIIGVTAVLSVLVCVLMPDTVAVQWNSSGASNYMSKYVSAAVALAASVLCAISWNTQKSKGKGYDIAHGALCCIGIVINIAVITMN